MERFPNVTMLQEEIMSRTYRRKKGEKPWWIGTTLVVPDGYYYYIRVELKGKERKREFARYHSDAFDPCTPNKEFRRCYGHKYDRARTRECLAKEMKALERGDVVFPKPRDIGWEWY